MFHWAFNALGSGHASFSKAQRMESGWIAMLDMEEINVVRKNEGELIIHFRS
jgi:hypothetical protein